MKKKTSTAKRHNVTLYKSQLNKAIRCSTQIFGKPNLSGFVQHLIDEYKEPKQLE